MKRNNISSDQQQNLHLTTWLKSVLNAQQIQFQQLGNGLVYCLLMNHYYPTLIPVKKICLVPRRHADYLNNMRLLNQVFSLLKWTHITFDINKIVAFVYAENIQLLSKIYQVLTKNQNYTPKMHQPISSVYAANRNIYQKQVKINQTAYPALKKGIKSSSLNEQTSKNQFNQPQIPSSLNLNMNLGPNIGTNSNSTTPLKNPIKPQPTIVDDIKGIVGLTDKTDRQKVNLLKNLLGIEVQQKINYEQQCQKDLLNDQSKKQSTIVIEDA